MTEPTTRPYPPPAGVQLSDAQFKGLLAEGYTRDEICDFYELMGDEWPVDAWTADQVQALRDQVKVWRADPASNASVRADLLAEGYHEDMIWAVTTNFEEPKWVQNAWTADQVQGLRDTLDRGPGAGRRGYSS